MRVLVVDDEARLAKHVASALTVAGHDPMLVHEGESALQEVHKNSFDMVVLDVGLPKYVV
jgi:DNA-binding response OmpR family regulator